MKTFNAVSAQIKLINLPLYAVSATAVNISDSPLLVFLHWHGFRRSTPLNIEGMKIPSRAVPSSALQFRGPWLSRTSPEEELLDLAWRLGAWSVERLHHRACNEPGAPTSEAYACRIAFGENPADYPSEVTLADDVPGRRDLMELAARKGYVRWLFHPVKGGLWKGVGYTDDSLNRDGGRESNCPVSPLTTADTRRFKYQLGRTDRLIIP